MIIPADEIVYRQVIGKLGNKILHALGTCGGLHVVESRSPDGKREVIGAGSHRAVARFIAKRAHPEIEYTMLEKSAEVDPRDFADILPFWEAVTSNVQKRLGS